MFNRFYLILEGKSLKDEQRLNELGLAKGGKLYFKDLGPQVGWTTVSEPELIPVTDFIFEDSNKYFSWSQIIAGQDVL
jgi:hypothetical protein